MPLLRPDNLIVTEEESVTRQCFVVHVAIPYETLRRSESRARLWDLADEAKLAIGSAVIARWEKMSGEGEGE
jgi:hypothetical protein